MRDERMTGTRSASTVLAPLFAVIVALALAMALGATSVSAASPMACRVKNTDTAKSYQALQDAVDAARKGDRLTVGGVCHGGTFIDKSLVIEGIQTPTTGKPVLDGDRKSRVLLIVKRVRVRLVNLVIRDGTTYGRGSGRGSCLTRDIACGRNGGGIDNYGHLILHDVIVRDSAARGRGGGISNDGSLTLNGSSRVSGNTAGDVGGGLYNGGRGKRQFPFRTGRLSVNGNSTIAHNSAVIGGGVANDGTVTLNGSGSVISNSAEWYGGGLLNAGILTLNGSSHISGNDAVSGGGGVVNDGDGRATLTLNDNSSVTGNTAEVIGGVSNKGTLTMNGATAINGNSARVWAGGVGNFGTFTMGDDSKVNANTAHGNGGGVFNRGTITMRGRSHITGNTALVYDGPKTSYPSEEKGLGGGLYSPGWPNYGEVSLQDESSITGNLAEAGGGGVAFQGSTAADNDLICAPAEGANVIGNTPDDCYFEP